MNYSSKSYLNIRIPMRDGITLAADLYLPPAEGPFPVILTRSPYGATNSRDQSALTWNRRNFAYIGVDCRGRFQSEGTCSPWVNECNDGFDTIEWIAQQPWCNGKIGMVGGSYVAGTQITAALAAHPALKAICPSAVSGDFFNIYYNGGALLASFMPSWHIGMCLPPGKSPAKDPDWNDLVRRGPLSQLDEMAGIPSPSWKEVVRHNTNDDFWKDFSWSKSVHKVKAPAFIQGSWYDLLGRDTIGLYLDLMSSPEVPEQVKRHSFLRIGPWGHGVNTPEGNYSFGEESIITEDLEIDFLNSILNEKDPKTDLEPGRICYFTMGANKWQYTNTWPPQDVQYVNFYMGSQGHANTRNGDGYLIRKVVSSEFKDFYTYDPMNPVPSCGGRMVGAGGQKDQSEVEMRDDMLVYTSPALADDLEVTGDVRLTLFVSSSAPDTDFTAKLVDVLPDGRAMNICEGILRTNYRNGMEKLAPPMEPGKVYELDLYVDVTSHQFQKGHAIRLEISSSNFPHYSRNLNTGEDPAAGTLAALADQTIFHSEKYPSCLILPVRGRTL